MKYHSETDSGVGETVKRSCGAVAFTWKVTQNWNMNIHSVTSNTLVTSGQVTYLRGSHFEASLEIRLIYHVRALAWPAKSKN